MGVTVSCMVLAFGRMRKENSESYNEFQVSVGYNMKPRLKKQMKNSDERFEAQIRDANIL